MRILPYQEETSAFEEALRNNIEYERRYCEVILNVTADRDCHWYLTAEQKGRHRADAHLAVFSFGEKASALERHCGCHCTLTVALIGLLGMSLEVCKWPESGSVMWCRVTSEDGFLCPIGIYNGPSAIEDGDKRECRVWKKPLWGNGPYRLRMTSRIAEYSQRSPDTEGFEGRKAPWEEGGVNALSRNTVDR
jgi:hypothetical protein